MTNALIDQQKAFAEYYVLSGGKGAQAAVQAGYAAGSAKQTAYRLLGLQHVQDEIRRQQVATVRGRLASKALGVLETILDDDTAPAGVRLDAAKTALDRAGISAARTPEALEDDDRPLEGLTLPELDRLTMQMQAILDQARTLEGTARVLTANSASQDQPA